MSKPGPRATTKVKMVLRYLIRTISIGLSQSEHVENRYEHTLYVDADDAGDIDKGCILRQGTISTWQQRLLTGSW